MRYLSRTVLAVIVAGSGLCILASVAREQAAQDPEVLFQHAVQLETIQGDLRAAIDRYKQVVSSNGGNRAVAARALLRLGGCYEKLGRAEAQKTYQQLINDYPEQAAEVASARQKLAGLAESSKERSSKPVFRKITIPGQLPAGAQLSPDGTRLAMATDGDIWIVNLQGDVAPEIAGTPVQLTRSANAAWLGLIWSGSWIAFNDSRIPSRDIYVLPASGGALRKVSRDVPILGGAPWWLGLSSDGSRLAYSANLDGRMVLQMVAVENNETVKRFANADSIEPRFSPDNSLVAYIRLGQWPSDELGEVRVVRLADGRDFPLTKTPMLFRSPAWSPDGSMLAFLAHPDKKDRLVEEIWIIPVLAAGEAYSEPLRIRLPNFALSIAGWTTGNRIGLLNRSLDTSAIYTVPSSGGRSTQVTPEGYGYNPQWSPDGEKIYFRWGTGDIAYVPAGGGTVRVVPRSGSTNRVSLPNGGNHISPDGTRIVWAGVTEGTPGVRLWTMPISGGEPVRLPLKPDLDSFQPRWSPDGKWIAFDSEREVPEVRKLDENIFIVSAQGGEPRQLTNHTDCFCELIAWSPTGDSIAYACSDQMIRIIPFRGGTPRTVLKADGLRTPSNSIAWTPDGSRILYSAKGRLWSVGVAGGDPEAISTDLDGKILQFALSPDGKRIALNAPSGGDVELWFMEDFLSLMKK